MSREKALVKNTIIYAIGNFGSKFVSFFLLPLYTFYLSKNDYGYFDIIFTTISLLIPVLSFQITDGMYRYMLTSQNEEEKAIYLTNSIFMILFNITIGSLIYLVVNFNISVKYTFIIYIMLISYLFFTVLSQAARGLNKNMVFSMSGVLYTILMAGSNIALIVVFKMRVDALIISTIVSCVVTLVYICYATKLYKMIKIRYFSFEVLKKLLIFSLPLIPNTIMWWVMNLSDRYMLGYFMGIDANGIYAVANKFPSLILTVNTIFYLAWQESAILEYKSKDRDIYYTNIFNKLMVLLMSSTIVMLAFTRLVSRFMIAGEFKEALLYMPVLYIAVVFSAFSSFYGTGYLSSEKTFGAFSTSIIGAVIKVLIGFILIPVIGIQAAAISTLAAFLVMWVVRIYQTRRYFNIKIDRSMLYSLLVLIIIFITAYYCKNLVLEIFTMALSIALFLLYNKNLILKGFNYAKCKFNLRG